MLKVTIAIIGIANEGSLVLERMFETLSDSDLSSVEFVVHFVEPREGAHVPPSPASFNHAWLDAIYNITIHYHRSLAVDITKPSSHYERVRLDRQTPFDVDAIFITYGPNEYSELLN